MLKKLFPALVAISAIAYSLFFIKEDVRHQPEVPRHVIETLDDEPGAYQRLSDLITFPTLGDPKAFLHVADPVPFEQLLQYITAAYPAVFKACSVEYINSYSLLLTWTGTDTSLAPAVLMSHLDVVPATTNGDQKWTHPPFSGHIDQEAGVVWGRGAIDTKSTLAGILEGAEQLLRQGFNPTRTIIFAFGHDEELGGEEGAHAVAEILYSRGIKPEVVLDEGGMILSDGIKAGNVAVVEKPIAIIGTAEKGFQTWAIKVQGTGGHSSIPTTGAGTTVSARISRILARIEKQQTSTRLTPAVADWLKTLGPHARFAPLRLVLSFADTFIVGPLLSQIMGSSGSNELSAMVRTTVAVVGVYAGGGAHNILPGEGTIVINIRTIQGDDEASMYEYLNTLIKSEQPFASIERVSDIMYNASDVSPATGPVYNVLEQAILETAWPGLGGVAPVVTPYLVTGMTDSRWYSGGPTPIAAGRVYRFSPVVLNREAGDLKTIHGVDERLRIDSFLAGVRFYMRFMKLIAGDAEDQ